MTGDRDDRAAQCRATVDFDQHSLDYRDRWREISDRHLAHCPVAWTEADGGYWVVSGYDTLRSVAADHRTFSSRWNLSPVRSEPAGISIPAGPYPKIPAELDPPEFLAYRRILSSALSAEQSDQLIPFILSTVEGCLDRAGDSGEIDLVLDLAAPLATNVVLRLFGLPLNRGRELAEALHVVEYTKRGTPEFEQAASTLASWMGDIEEGIALRRRQPSEDLLSALVNAVIADQPIPTNNIVGICYLVLGSVDNTAGFIASALHWLYRFPEQRRLLIDRPDLIPRAIDELLRYLAPIHGLARTATRDTTLNGQQIAAGERLWLHFAAANRDPAVFDHPDEIRFDRSPNRHATFGFGIHRCAGAPLTLLESKMVIEVILARHPTYTIALDGTHHYEDVAKFNGFKRMPANLNTGPAAGRRGTAGRDGHFIG